uniref:THO complex subunit 1-like n=1 Tax=Hirondellea gigas TaxID=1518452 RepID=A0A6A7FRD8_9CRUS
MAAAAVVNQTVNNTSPVLQIMSHDTIFNKIQEVLPDCIAADEVKPFLEIFDAKVSEPIKLYVETAVRYYVMQSLSNGNDTDLSKIMAVAKLSTALTRKDVCLPTLPMLVLSDAFDSMTVQQCERLFSFVESNVAVWKEPLFFTPCKNQVLRMCNDVLRRLSRSQNTIFCGRILLFLARFFPFSERSGLNLISEFNLENITTYTSSEVEDGMEVTQGKEEGGDDEVKEISAEKEDSPVKDSKPALDHTLYTKFWALQDFFRNPIQCYQDAPWQMFTTYTNDVLEAFSSFKLEGDNSVAATADKAPQFYTDITVEMQNHDDTIVDALPDVKKIDQYFAKFLTNQRLLELQFSDSNFRRYVLVQLLILCNYLTAVIRFKLETLEEIEKCWVHSTELKVFSLMKETPPDGEQFVEIVKKILRRENLWNDWKNNGCPEIKKPVIHPLVTSNGTVNGKLEGEGAEEEKSSIAKRGKKRKLGDLVREADSRNKFVMANPEMTRLWNICPDNVQATQQKKRNFIPSLEDYFMRAIDQIHSTEEIPTADKLVNDGNFGWRGLRILACRSPHFFTHSTAPIATLPEYLTTMIKKLAKDLPAVQLKLQQQAAAAATKAKQTAKAESKPAAEEEMETQADEAAAVCEPVEDEVEEEDTTEHVELNPITEQQQEALAANIAKNDKYKILTKKLGFKDDEVDYILEQKTGNVQQCIAHFLKLWVENEGDEANQDSITYILEGLKMPEAATGVFE